MRISIVECPIADFFDDTDRTPLMASTVPALTPADPGAMVDSLAESSTPLEELVGFVDRELPFNLD